MSDFCSVDNPFVPTARMARDAERSQRREVQEAEWKRAEEELRESRKEREPRDWAPQEMGTNFPILLQQLALEDDSSNRYDARYRNRVRKFLVAARLASATDNPGITDWEERYKRRQNAEVRRDRVEANRARKAGLTDRN